MNESVRSAGAHKPARSMTKSAPALAGRGLVCMMRLQVDVLVIALPTKIGIGPLPPTGMNYIMNAITEECYSYPQL
ncbi:hypothetical protein BJV78DRAFT_1253642 [Lactifluus subvellereus]|nr:hypothetical protein BJV78DRAFT_1253642 [Lactifluus subvellereus]